MVQSRGDARDFTIVVEPNRSATWAQNKLLLAALSVWCLAIATAFAAAGLWLVLPFAGLELAALAAALYWVSWKLRERHVVRFSGEHVRIEKGFYHVRRSWELPRDKVTLSVAILNHPEDPLQLSLCAAGEIIPVGDFLNREDSRALLGLLRDAGVMVRNYSRSGRLPF